VDNLLPGFPPETVEGLASVASGAAGACYLDEELL